MSGWEMGHYVVSPSNFEVLLVLTNLLRSPVLSRLAKRLKVIQYQVLRLSAPILQNGQTHSNNSSVNCRQIA